jgi:DNA-binding MarR family transcriptional regulator
LGANVETPTNGRLREDDGDSVALVETEMAVLARVLERLQRRSKIHWQLDRASYLVARTLDATGPVRISHLASMLGLDATTVTRQVATMETAQLVARRADPNDGRVSLIRLSSRGRREVRATKTARRRRVAELLGGWTEEDRRQLGHVLEKFNDALVKALDDPVTPS